MWQLGWQKCTHKHQFHKGCNETINRENKEEGQGCKPFVAFFFLEGGNVVHGVEHNACGIMVIV